MPTEQIAPEREADIFNVKPKPRPPAHIIKSDAEAIEIAKKLAVEFAKDAAIRDAERRLPLKELDMYSQSGIWGMQVPKEYGGAYVSYATLGECSKIISEADSSIGQIYQNHTYMVETIRLHGSEQQKKYFFGLILKGIRFGNAFSEIGSKSLLTLNTTLTPHKDGYLLNGRKFYCTGALFADWVPVWAQDDQEKNVIAYVEKGTPGLRVIDDWSCFGQRTTCSGTVTCENVFVPKEHIIPDYKGWDNPSILGPLAQIVHVAIDLGLAYAAVKETIRYVKKQTRPWIDTDLENAYDDPYTIRDIGDLEIRCHAADMMLRRYGEYLDVARENPNETTVAEASIAGAEAKALSTEAAILATNKLFELAGTSSTMQKNHLDRYWRDARAHTLHDPVRWKYYNIGNYYLNDVKPKRHAWI
jgi:SfnB family sulfur acquisition oxidoreductase